MKKYILGFLGLVLLAGMISCEPNNPYNIGPTYDAEKYLKIDSVKIAEYLEVAEIDSLYRIHDPSGVVIIVQEEGEGSRPEYGNQIYTDYVGMLTDDTVFDTNIQSVAEDNGLHEEGDVYRPLSFELGSGVVQGFSLGFRRLRSGSKAVLVIPSPYGYQSQERERIPENSVLVFEVDFLGMD
ncbi:FKBP-type peptidyl-prolyl cis-trans isomerase [Echinicola marina]|uniref:FKBP-type peptidyl-prolyl cis-trans isomerase n=1 Tax=Echinicola marina TaxID=2859768 RepID=UPI001CF6266C|nr:FKBP-type peptidyl-prolyl cis-trans isomerase [Echinicola marina]UCS94723.1 FKBP-type peptidyl-prolyl cis-trans isomerase [Echinicola marina]